MSTASEQAAREWRKHRAATGDYARCDRWYVSRAEWPDGKPWVACPPCWCEHHHSELSIAPIHHFPTFTEAIAHADKQARERTDS